MTASTSRGTALLVRWSPAGVRVFDQSTSRWHEGTSLEDCLGSESTGRDVVVGVDQRSAFVRCISVPNISRDEVSKLMAFKLAPMLPLTPSAYVSNFRLSAPQSGESGRLAVVGAIKAESLRRIHEEAAACGLRLGAVLPVAFGSWLAARAHSLTDCAVVEAGAETLSIDVVSHGELNYSRSVPLPDSIEEVEEEILRTFRIAEVRPSSVLSLASPDVPSDIRDPREALEFLSDANALEKLLFTLELHERTAAKAARAGKRTAGLGIFALALALGLGFYDGKNWLASADAADAARVSQQRDLRDVVKAEADSEKRLAVLRKENQMMGAAFGPSQSFSDIEAVLAAAAPEDSWLTGLTLEHGKPFILHGAAKEDRAVAKYVAALTRDPRFREVKLIFANTGTIGKKTVIQFSISGHAIGNLPIDDVPKPRHEGPVIATPTKEKTGSDALEEALHDQS